MKNPILRYMAMAVMLICIGGTSVAQNSIEKHDYNSDEFETVRSAEVAIIDQGYIKIGTAIRGGTDSVLVASYIEPGLSVRWTYEYSEDTNNDNLAAVDITRVEYNGDEHFLILGRASERKFNSYMYGILILIDYDGNVIWTRNVARDNEDYNEFCQPARLAHKYGSSLGIGVLSTLDMGNDDDLLFSRYDTDGNPLNMVRYDNQSEERAVDLHLNSSGNGWNLLGNTDKDEHGFTLLRINLVGTLLMQNQWNINPDRVVFGPPKADTLYAYGMELSNKFGTPHVLVYGRIFDQNQHRSGRVVDDYDFFIFTAKEADLILPHGGNLPSSFYYFSLLNMAGTAHRDIDEYVKDLDETTTTNNATYGWYIGYNIQLTGWVEDPADQQVPTIFNVDRTAPLIYDQRGYQDYYGLSGRFMDYQPLINPIPDLYPRNRFLVGDDPAAGPFAYWSLHPDYYQGSMACMAMRDEWGEYGYDNHDNPENYYEEVEPFSKIEPSINVNNDTWNFDSDCVFNFYYPKTQFSTNDQLEGPQFSLFPNPVMGTVANLQITGLESMNVEVIVYNAQGQRLYRRSLTSGDIISTALPTDPMAPGLNMVQVIADGMPVWTGKLIK